MEKPRYTISRTQPNDVESALRMRAQSWLDTYPNEENGVSEDFVRTRIQTWMDPVRVETQRMSVENADDSRVLHRVARDEQGNIVGMIAASKERPFQKIHALYVDKAHHGTGVAAQLMNESLAWFDSGRPVVLEVASYNDRAIAFYRKHGFSELKGSEHLFADEVPAIDMVRKGEKA
jgi:ribosomal protein S18 acetylase RimI-like enzyme